MLFSKMATEIGTILTFPEAEMYIEALQTIPLKSIGCERWRIQHEYLEKLNMQAVLNATSNTDEFIKEALVSQNKIAILIYDLLSIELWENNIFKHLLDLHITSNSSLPIYMVLFHQATILNLLETVLFHKEPCECAGDAILDLLDYCCRKITHLIIRSEQSQDTESKEAVNKSLSVKEELRKQAENIAYDVSLKSISVLTYITDHMTSLPLSVMTRMLNTHDLPCLLVKVLDFAPWKRISKNGNVQMYANKEWKDVSTQDSFRVSKLEGQIWLTLYHLLMNPEAQRKYEFTNYRKSQVLKLRKYLNEALIDQISCLTDMQRYLEELSIMETSIIKKELILEQVPEIRDALEKENKGKWKEIAAFQLKEYFSPSELQMKEQAQKLAATYNLDVLEALTEEAPKCALCGKQATKRCSQCRSEWYCTRPCQVKHWSVHKSVCSVVAENKVT